MARAWRAALVLLPLLVVPAQGHGGDGSIPDDDVVKVCSEKLVDDANNLQLVCMLDNNKLQITGHIALKGRANLLSARRAK